MADRFALCSQCGVVAASCCCCTASDDRILGRSARLAHRWRRDSLAASPAVGRSDDGPGAPLGGDPGRVGASAGLDGDHVPDLAVGPLTAPARVVPLRVLRAVRSDVPAPGDGLGSGVAADPADGAATGTRRGPLIGAWDGPATGAWDAAGRSAGPQLAGYGALPDTDDGATGAWAGPATGAALVLADEPAVDDLVDGLVDGPVGAVGGAALLPPVVAAARGGAALLPAAEPVSDPPSAPAEGVEALLQAPRRPLRFYVAPFGTPPFGNPPGGVDSTPFAAAEVPVRVAAGRGTAARMVEVASVSVLSDTGAPASHDMAAAAPVRNRRSRPAWGPPNRAGA